MSPARFAAGDISTLQWPASLRKLDLSEVWTITGDLGNVQWPASLQNLDLSNCLEITGKFSVLFDSVLAPHRSRLHSLC